MKRLLWFPAVRVSRRQPMKSRGWERAPNSNWEAEGGTSNAQGIDIVYWQACFGLSNFLISFQAARYHDAFNLLGGVGACATPWIGGAWPHTLGSCRLWTLQCRGGVGGDGLLKRKTRREIETRREDAGGNMTLLCPPAEWEVLSHPTNPRTRIAARSFSKVEA